MATVIDSDQHLVEPRTLWLDHIDPAARDDALRIVDDELGHAWLTWRDRRLQPLVVQSPRDTEEIGRERRRVFDGLPPARRYDDALPRDHWDPAARVETLDAMGVDEAMCFPNYGLGWERTLDADLPALTANMTAWNRWCATVVQESGARLHPVAHLTLRDADWLIDQLAACGRAGIRTAMIAPALVDDRPLSHPDHDRLWAAFCDHGVTPVFHVADQRRPFDDAWYTDPDDRFVPVLESVFLWTPAALACTDLILNGVLERFPDLRLGIVELSAIWVGMWLMMLDGGFDFTTKLNGRTVHDLPLRPSEYFRRQVRVSSFAYELPARLIRESGDLFMCCSDYPHSEGTDTPLSDYAAAGRHGIRPDDAPGLFHDNAAFLLRRG